MAKLLKTLGLEENTQKIEERKRVRDGCKESQHQWPKEEKPAKETINNQSNGVGEGWWWRCGCTLGKGRKKRDPCQKALTYPISGKAKSLPKNKVGFED